MKQALPVPVVIFCAQNSAAFPMGMEPERLWVSSTLAFHILDQNRVLLCFLETRGGCPWKSKPDTIVAFGVRLGGICLGQGYGYETSQCRAFQYHCVRVGQ